MANQDYDPSQSSVAVGGQGGKEKRGLLLLLLALVVLILVALAIGLVSCTGDDEGDAAAPVTPTTISALSATSATPSEPSTSTPATSEATAATLTAASQPLLGSGADPIKDHLGERATGSGLKVLSLSENGFFVGTDDADRQYVEFGGKVGEDEPRSDRPEVGASVDLQGPVRPAPEDPEATLKLSADDAAFVAQQDAYVNADTVSPTAG